MSGLILLGSGSYRMKPQKYDARNIDKTTQYPICSEYNMKMTKSQNAKNRQLPDSELSLSVYHNTSFTVDNHVNSIKTDSENMLFHETVDRICTKYSVINI